nr:MAG TPA: hypothetical protein [Crassvirales sp.]
MNSINENNLDWFRPIPEIVIPNQRENNRISGKTTATIGRLAKEIKLLKHTIKTFRKEKAYKYDIKKAEILLDKLKSDLYELQRNKNSWFKNTEIGYISRTALENIYIDFAARLNL